MNLSKMLACSLAIATTLARASDITHSPMAWARQCELLLTAEPTDLTFLELAASREAALATAHASLPVPEHLIGRLRYLIDLAQPIPTSFWFIGVHHDTVESLGQVAADFSLRPQEVTGDRLKRLMQLNENLKRLTSYDLWTPLGVAFPRGRIVRATVTHAAVYGEGEVNVLTNAIVDNEGTLVHVKLSRLVNFNEDSVAYDKDGSELDFYAFHSLNPSSALIYKQVRSYLKLMDLIHAHAQIQLYRTHLGFRARVRNFCRGRAFDLKINPGIHGQFVIEKIH